MSTTQSNKAPPTKPRKERERERKEKEKQHPPESERLKTVVRRLPPNLPDSVFWQSVETWVTDQTVTWKIYYPGKFRKRLNKENIPSRAYIAFKTEEQLARFGREYDGHLFRDKAGNESYAIVEFAPYQKVPSEKKKPDARNATIEQDEDYISFLDALNAPGTTEPVSMESLVAAIQHLPAPKTTPLLEALKAEKLAHKDKESILRNHAHYKDQPAAVAGAPRKDDLKKRGGPIPISKVTPAPPTDAGNIVAPGGGNAKKSHKKGQAPASAAAATAPMAAQKVTPQVNPAAKNVNVQPIPGPASKSPKASRGVRLPPQPRGGTKAVPTATLEVPVVAPPAPGDPGPHSRRPRPVIGPPSRHFEAALNGAGVDRKPRRERENVKETEAATLPPPVTSSGTAPTEGAQIQLSPRRDRGGRKEVPPAYTPGAGAIGGPLDPPKVPGILQRTDGPPAPAVGMPRIDNDGGVGPPAQDVGAPSFRGGRGGRRGRGRGRGARGG